MAQVFPVYANTLARLSLIGAIVLPAAGIGGLSMLTRSSANTGVGVAKDQPIPFSHEHHVNELGIDCRYCHTSVEKSAYAGIPPTHTCMSCHSQIWTNSPLLEPLRKSYETGEPIRSADGTPGWNRVNKVPDFVYFNHSIHVNRGINCNTCHGPVQKMQLMYKGQAFFMTWCLQCHRQPEKFVNDRRAVFGLYRRSQELPPARLTAEERTLLDGGEYSRSPHELAQGRRLLKQYGVQKNQLTDCWICHR
jgi:hypothetical protein